MEADPGMNPAMQFFQRLWVQLHFILSSLFYGRHLYQSFLYSLQRDRQERRFAPPPATTPWTPPGQLLKAELIDRSGYFYFEQAELEIVFLAADLVRVHWFPGLPPIPYALARRNWSEVEVEVVLQEQGDRWCMASGNLRVSLSREGQLSFYNSAGQLLRQEQPPQRRDTRWRHQAQLHPEERIYGLGERAASLNLRASWHQQALPPAYRMWNFDPAGRYGPGADPLYLCIPVYLGLHPGGSYGIFYENSFDAQFSFGEFATADFEGGSLRYYLILGEPAQVLERYTELTGRAPLPPRWALGYHQSRWGFRNEINIREEIRGFYIHDLPLSAVHLDIDCQVGQRAFTLDPQRFPHLTAFTQELASQGVQLIAINNPGIQVNRASNLFLEGEVLEAFCTYPNGERVVAPVWAGRTVFPDFTNPKVRSWWSRQYAYLLDVGVAGFWHDMNEPAVFSLWGDRSLPKAAQHCLEGRGGDHREAHNLYGLLEAEAAYESLRQYRPQQRPFIVSRSGWAGLQRYAWTWTGDIRSDWTVLRQTIATVVGLGLSGIPYSGPDIGGFAGNPPPELYLRWFQMATFLPFYRTHAAINVHPRAPWTYGEPYLQIIRQYLKLRDRLRPYLYSLAWEAATKGYPLVRPLFWSDWRDQRLWDLEDAFCLGEALLICPILEPGATTRPATLPQGAWYNFWDDQRLEGGTEVELEASLEQIPILVRAGSILPMTEPGDLILHLYPPQAGLSQTQLYTDAGDGYGESRLDHFQLCRSQQRLELLWEQQGSYPLPYRGVELQLHGVQVQQAWIDGHPVTMPGKRLRCPVCRQVRWVIKDLPDTSMAQ